MLRITRTLASSLVLIVAVAIAPAAANASPIGKLLHLHPRAAQTKDTRVTVYLQNKGELFQDVKVGERVYTVLPHESIAIKAPIGTPVYTVSVSFGHSKGELLFTATQATNGAIIHIN
jgi:hypothetical protein